MIVCVELMSKEKTAVSVNVVGSQWLCLPILQTSTVCYYSGAPLIQTSLGPSTRGWIIEVSSPQELLGWLIAEIHDVKRPVTSQARHMEATKILAVLARL